jgi:hypothetical protein
MSYTLKVDHPELGKGSTLQIPGLGEFENGKSYELEDETIKGWEQSHALTVPGEDGEDVVISLKERIANMYGVKITKSGTTHKDEKKEGE